MNMFFNMSGPPTFSSDLLESRHPGALEHSPLEGLHLDS